MAVEEARTADAERHAPYEWWSAVTYLHKARELAGVADFESAIDFGRKAEMHAKKARQLALDRAGGPTAEPGGPPSDSQKAESP